MTKVIGIDPGLAATGVGVVTGRGVNIGEYACGSIYTAQSLPLPARLDHIFSRLFEVLKNEKADLMVVEDIFSLARYPKSGITLGKVTGVILLACHQLGVPVTEIPVREVKQVLTGNGSATKSQLEKAVRHTLNAKKPIKPSHASDALALAIIGLFRHSDVSRTM